MLIRLPMLSAVTVAVLVWFRPDPISLRSGEEAALAGAWAIALFGAVWLLAVSSSCALALRRGRVDTARRCAALIPSVLRRGMELTIVTAAVAASTLPAHALTDEPVVRTPQAASTPTTTPSTTERTPPPSTRPSTTTTPPRPPATATDATTSTTRAVPPAQTPEPEPDPDVATPRATPQRPAPKPPTSAGATYVVRPGDNLWVIAQRTLEQHERPARELVAYWHAVIEANVSSLRSGDPNLIYPGETLTLPDFGDSS